MRRLYKMAAAALVVLTAATSVSAQPETPYVWITPQPGDLVVGQTFITTVHISGASGIYGASLKINYDPQLLQVVLQDGEVVRPGSFFAGQPAFTLRNSSSGGVIEYALTLTQPAEPLSGSGTLGTIVFRPLADRESTITVLEARLLVPNFTEVNGQRVAFEINEVAAQTQPLTLTVHSSASAPEPAVAALEAPSIPAETPTRPAALPVLLVGTLLFLIGLALFVLSVGGYARLRQLDSQQEAL